MTAKRLPRLGVAGVLLLLQLGACAGGEPRDDARIVPEGLRVTALQGGNGVLEVIALTLREGAESAELYVALRNEGDTPACSAAVAVELFDADGRSLAASINGLLTQRFYRLTDGSQAIAACVRPGEVTMAALTDLPPEVAVDDVATIVYRCPYFALDVVPLEGLSIEHLWSVPRDAGTAYTGTLINGLDVVVARPSVTVFPTNRVGRPLAVAVASSDEELAPGGSWSFETGPVDVPAQDALEQLAFPAGALPAPTASARR